MRGLLAASLLLALCFSACEDAGGGAADTPQLDSSGEASPCKMNRSAQCTPAAGSQTVGFVYGLDALPSGPCSEAQACSLLVDPCPNWQAHPGERADDYGCTCSNGIWTCEDCMMGTGVCLESSR